MPGKRNLKRVHELLSMSPEALVEFAKENWGLEKFAGGLFHLALERQAQVAGEEAGSNFTTIANQLQFMTFPEIAKQTASSNFDPYWLARGDTDVFVVVPRGNTRARERVVETLDRDTECVSVADAVGTRPDDYNR